MSLVSWIATTFAIVAAVRTANRLLPAVLPSANRCDGSTPYGRATRQEMAYLFELCEFDIEAECLDFARGVTAYGQRQILVLQPCYINR